MIPAPFWHPSGNPNIWLWVPFTGGSMQDISIYNRTPVYTDTTGTTTFTSGFMNIDITSSSPTAFTSQVSYAISPTPASNFAGPITMEGFIKWIASVNATLPGEIFHFDTDTTTAKRWNLIFANVGKYGASATGSGQQNTASNVLAPSGTLYHWAWVMPNTATQAFFYINGVNTGLTLLQGAANWTYTPATARWMIGGQISTQTSPFRTAYSLGETRVSHANLYPNGTTFTPPTPGNLPPVP